MIPYIFVMIVSRRRSRFLNLPIIYSDISGSHFIIERNPLPPSDAIRGNRKILEDPLSPVLSELKTYYPSGNSNFNDLGVFQSL